MLKYPLKSAYNKAASDKFFPLQAHSVQDRYLKFGSSELHNFRNVNFSTNDRFPLRPGAF